MNNLIAFVDRLAQAGAVPALGPTGPNRRMPAGWGPHDSLEVKYDVRVVRNADGCWGWIGQVNPVNGYAYIGKLLAHRYAHERFIGPIPPGYEVDHRCRVRTCTNPAHLEAVTPQENKRRVHDLPLCRNGHEWTPETTHHTPAGRRNCRTCNAAKARRLRARRRLQREA